MKEFRKRVLFDVALCASFVSLIHSPVAYSVNFNEVLIADASPSSQEDLEVNGHQINFNEISIVEFIRFVSKITNLNFVFEEADLQFTVTVVSEEPVSTQNVMSALAQILRVHQMSLLEQDNNVLIVKGTDVNQIPTIISSDLPESAPGNAALVTRVFRIKNANINSVANVIRPMCSKGALIEISNETRQLIVTDITTNVQKISELLMSLDAPHTPLDMDMYECKNMPPPELIQLTQQIIAPFAEGNPVIFVPQLDTNTIFLVSTPYLIERAVTIMEDLDIPPKGNQIAQRAQLEKSVYIYKAIYRTPDELVNGLNQINDQLKSSGGPTTALEEAIDNLQEVNNTNSLMFLADADTVAKLKDLLASLDTTVAPSSAKTSLYIYKIQIANEEQIEQSLNQTAKQLESAPVPDQDLIDAINSMRWIRETNSLVFTGTEASLNYLKTILPTFDVSPVHSKTGLSQAGAKSHFLIYIPKHQSGTDLQTQMEGITENLRNSGLADPSMLQALDSMKWESGSNSLIFTGDPQSLDKIRVMLENIDVAGTYAKGTQVFIYKPQYASSSQIQSALQKLVPTLDPNSPSDQALANAITSMEWNNDTQSFIVTSDPATIARLKDLLLSLDNAQELTGKSVKGFFLYKLGTAQGDNVIDELKALANKIPTDTVQNQNVIDSIKKLEWVKSTNSILITGQADAIEQIKTLIAEFDVPAGASAMSLKSNFMIYKPTYLTSQQLEGALQDTSQDLQEAGLTDPDLMQSLASMRYVAATDSLIFTGSPPSLEKVKGLISHIDSAEGAAGIQHIGKTTFLIYKLKYVTADQLIAALKNFSAQLPTSTEADRALVQCLNTMRYIKETNSVLFTGSDETLERVNTLLEKFDNASLAPPEVTAARGELTYVIYEPKYLAGQDIITVLEDFEVNLKGTGICDAGLFDAINNLKWIEQTSTLLISGDEASIAKVQDLLKRFDVPSKDSAASIESIDNVSFLVYKLQYHPGSDIQTALKQIALDLKKSSGAAKEGAPSDALTAAVESVQWIEVTNSLLASGQPDVLVKLKDLIQNLDTPLRQVFIEVLVITTTLANNQNFGLQWGGQMQYLNKAALGTGNFPLSAANGSAFPANAFGNNLAGINATTTPTAGGGNPAVPFSTGFDLGVIGDIIMHKGKSFISLGSLVNALQIDNQSTVVMNPKIIAQDNKQSNLFVGSNVPFTGATVQNVGSNTTVTTANIEYRDVGVSLTITPILGDNNIVTLDITHDITEEIAGQNTNTTGIQLTGITTSHTHMETRVHVPDQHFVCLSGMVMDTKNVFRTGIPCLGGLPVIGLLFSENDRLDSKSNVIIFMRPHIIRNYDEYKKLTEHQEWLFKDQARVRGLKEQFDEGIDLVKTPENE